MMWTDVSTKVVNNLLTERIGTFIVTLDVVIVLESGVPCLSCISKVSPIVGGVPASSLGDCWGTPGSTTVPEDDTDDTMEIESEI